MDVVVVLGQRKIVVLMVYSGTLPPLTIGDITVPVPVIQGGMSVGISLSRLASAVANEGGIGVIGAAGIGLIPKGIPEDYQAANAVTLKDEVLKAREMTDGPIGVNIMMALTDFDSLITAAVEVGVDFIFLGAGKLLRAPPTLDMEKLRDSSTKVVIIVSSARNAEVVFKFWSNNYGFTPDAVVVEGPLAGGHLGYAPNEIDDPNFTLEAILPTVIEAVKPWEEKHQQKIPVIAAGGVYTGSDIHRFLEMGAAGVQMGTRFVTTYECDAADEFKQAHLDAKEEDIMVIQSPVGLPGRAIQNDFLRKVEAGEKNPICCPWKCLRTCDWEKSPYCIANALTSARKGKMGLGYAFAGSNAYRSEKLVHVKELMQNLVDEYEAAIK